MVTLMRTEQKVETLPEIGERIGIPIEVRPWWGSRRQRASRYHRKCGDFLGLIDRYCPHCHEPVRPKDVELRQRWPRRWLCPGEYSYARVKWPEIQNGTVVLWEGPCRDRYNGRFHKHRQELEVLDVADQALLLKATVSWNSSHFLIGIDDGHSFVTLVVRRCTTVQDAFDWLVPNKVREAMILGLDVKRQGDWFFIPSEKPPRIHPHGDEMRWLSPSLRKNALYRGVPLAYRFEQTRHTGGLVVYQSVQRLPYPAPLVKGNVKAPGHPTLHLNTWHIGIRRRSTGAGNRDGAAGGD